MSERTHAARSEDTLVLSGSVGANRVMERELLRLVKRSPFHVRVPTPRRAGSGTVHYPFDASVAWVAACYHRSCSSVSWELASSPSTRLEPLHDDLVPLLADDDRLPREELSFSVEVRDVHDFEAGPLQVRGVVKSAVEEAMRRRGASARVDAEKPDMVLVVRRAGADDARRTHVAIDLGGAGRHVRGHRRAIVEAPLRETLAAQLVQFSRWDSRSEVLVDPMAGGGTIGIEAVQLAQGRAVRQPVELRLGALLAFDGLPEEAPPLFPGPLPRVLMSDVNADAVPAMIGNLRAAGLTGPEVERAIVVRELDARELTPAAVTACWREPCEAGVFCFNPPYGHRLEGGGAERLDALYARAGRALGAFAGWRAAVFVANEGFVPAFGLRPRSTKPASNARLRGAFHLFEL